MLVTFSTHFFNFVFIFLVEFDPTIEFNWKIELIKLRLRLSVVNFATVIVKIRMRLSFRCV
jgi:hypothetical protein